MSLWQSCKCKACGYEWRYELFSLYDSYKNDYKNQYCEKCIVLLEDKKRLDFFSNNEVSAELEDYKYVLQCIANSDGWIIDENPLCTVETAYDKCVEMAINIVKKYE